MLRHKALTQCARLALGVGGGFWEVSGFDTPTYSTASEHKSKSSSSDDKARRYTSQAALKRTIASQDELSQPLKAAEPNPAS